MMGLPGIFCSQNSADLTDDGRVVRSSIIGILLFSLFSMAGCVPTNVSKGAKSENTSTAKAVTAVISQIVPSPVAIVLQVGQWMIAEDTKEEVFYVRVQASGLTESEARKEAFRLAVDQAVGSLLVAETEIRNEQLIRHDVINYSSGYIYDFEYVNIYRGAGEVVLQVDVWVSKSDIATRIFGKSSADADIAGAKIDQSLKSLQIQQNNADRLTSVVLGDYPYKSYRITIKGSEQFITDQRQPVLRIRYDIGWDDNYLTSLRETLNVTSSRYKKENYIVFDSFWGKRRPDYIDAILYRLYWDNLYNKGATQLIQLWSHDGFELYKACLGTFIDQRGDNAMQIGHSGIMINESYYRSFYHDINLTNIPLQNLDSYTIQAVRFKDCN